MILITGGAGYVGSHTCKALARLGEEHIVFDNLSTGHEWAVRWGKLFHGDLRNLEDVRACFQRYPIDAVIHFAALSLVGESGQKPEEYYQTNVVGTLNLLQVMREFQVNRIVFSSSAAVYGEPEQVPIPEDHLLRPVNVYGRTKVIMEMFMADYARSYGFHYAALRYFNAAGADPEGETGEVHHPETHLIPNLIRAAFGHQEALDVYDTDYPTPDGSAIRDYIHVSDLAQGPDQPRQQPRIFRAGSAPYGRDGSCQTDPSSPGSSPRRRPRNLGRQQCQGQGNARLVPG